MIHIQFFYILEMIKTRESTNGLSCELLLEISSYELGGQVRVDKLFILMIWS